MGLTKTKGFTHKQLELSAAAKALGHPARIAILQHLISTRQCICGDIVDELPLSQSTISQHLKELREAGLIKGNIQGPSICYCIDARGWEKAKRELGAFMESFTGNDCC